LYINHQKPSFISTLNTLFSSDEETHIKAGDTKRKFKQTVSPNTLTLATDIWTLSNWYLNTIQLISDWYLNTIQLDYTCFTINKGNIVSWRKLIDNTIKNCSLSEMRVPDNFKALLPLVNDSPLHFLLKERLNSDVQQFY
jgi:poly-beta-hydroxyalkanoate depolymerase